MQSCGDKICGQLIPGQRDGGGTHLLWLLLWAPLEMPCQLKQGGLTLTRAWTGRFLTVFSPPGAVMWFSSAIPVHHWSRLYVALWWRPAISTELAADCVKPCYELYQLYHTGPSTPLIYASNPPVSGGSSLVLIFISTAFVFYLITRSGTWLPTIVFYITVVEIYKLFFFFYT